ERTALAVEVEGAMAALEGIARAMAADVVVQAARLETRAGEPPAPRGDPGARSGEDLLARALLVRYAVQQAVERAAARAAELLGGMAFVASPEVACLLASARALAYPPPSRLAASEALDAYLAGGPLRLG